MRSLRDRSISRTINSCVFISVDGVSTRKDAPIKTIKFIRRGDGSGSYTIFIEKVVSSEEADASEKPGRLRR